MNQRILLFQLQINFMNSLQKEQKEIQGLLAHSQEVALFSPAFSYVIKAYAAQKLSAYLKKLQPSPELNEGKVKLGQLINELGELKNQHALLQNKDELKKAYSEFVYKLFFDADTRERDGEVSAELMQMFQACTKFFEVFNYFEPLSQEQQEKIKYCKFKLVEQVKKLKNPQLIQPKKADPIEEELQRISQQEQQKQAQPPQIHQNSQPSNQQTFQPQPQPQQQQPISSQYQQQQHPQATKQFYPPPQNFQSTKIEEAQPKQQQPIPTASQANQQQNTLIFQNQQIQKPTPTQMNSQVMPTGKVVNALEQAQLRSKIKTMLQSAISELDFKKYAETKKQIEQAMILLSQLPD